ncbi:MAG: BON domain-containing protein [Chitinophagaceae bacterium]|nr:BON domain-containing protein [Chitinophagaceae bacterium]
MQKTFSRSLYFLAIAAFVSLSLFSCKSGVKDADIEAKIQANAALSHVAATVKDGVVTLSGEAKDEADKANAEAAVTAIEGVKQVVNNLTIAPPPPPPPVIISGDDQLNKGIADALKDFPTVQATAKDSIITVTGETTAANWKKIKIALDGLRPKKVDPKGLKIK